MMSIVLPITSGCQKNGLTSPPITRRIERANVVASLGSEEIEYARRFGPSSLGINMFTNAPAKNVRGVSGTKTISRAVGERSVTECMRAVVRVIMRVW
jgi:hypothetical protein